MDMWRVRVDMHCASCGFTTRQDALDLLRRAGMLRRAGDDVDEHLVTALLAAAATRLECPQCGHVGVAVEPLDDSPDDFDQRPEAKACQQCGKPIPIERLRLLPDNAYCADCQRQRETGMLTEDEREFCPRCGQVLTQRATRRRGVTEYVAACPGCGYVG